ncbi:MAG: dihydroorotase [Dehalococcoidia bacterium]|nr:dihydroorotase [Dehalococcoidia bacterium]
MKDILIKGGRVIDPSRNIDAIADLFLSDGKVQALTHLNQTSDAEIIDARGLIVCPGFIDLHTHLRQPGYEYKETIASGTQSAARGGFTTVCCMPNTDPPMDNAALVGYVKHLAAQEGLIRVLPIGTITCGRQGEDLADMAELSHAGVIAFSDDGSYVASAHLVRRAMEYVRSLEVPIIEHCEEPTLSKGGQMNEGAIATRLGLLGIPSAAEEIAAARDIILAELTGAHLHLAHVSTAGTIELIRQAKRRGVTVTAEVTPHHLTMTEEMVLGYNTQAKVNPPLRTPRDTEALVAGLQDGTLDAIATDHAPHTENDKLCEFTAAAFGISGLETALGSLMGLVHNHKLDIGLLISSLTTGPSRILGKNFANLGTLATGANADVVIFDSEAEWTVDAAAFVSKGKNTPLHGAKLKGKVLLTIYNGEIVYRYGGI